ncbi:uncharacterized protein METZ01_LOCUS435843, partial [marine metagenome]
MLLEIKKCISPLVTNSINVAEPSPQTINMI